MGEYIFKIYNRIIGFFKFMIWKLLFGRHFEVGFGSVFYPGCHIMIEKSGALKIGKNCFFNRGCSLTSLGKIEIGNDCIFGEDVKIYDHNHHKPNANNLIRTQGYDVGSVRIGNNVWIGSNCLILSNVEIGDNVIIGAGSIITKSVEKNTIIVQKKNSTILPFYD